MASGNGEGHVHFYSMAKGSWDSFPGVVVGARMGQVGGNGFARVESVLSVKAARRLAKTINDACDIVEEDQKKAKQ